MSLYYHCIILRTEVLNPCTVEKNEIQATKLHWNKSNFAVPMVRSSGSDPGHFSVSDIFTVLSI